MKKIFILLLAVFIAACSNKPTMGCYQDSDCAIPMEYTIQSNCPFGAACIDSQCKVVCPIANPAPINANEAWVVQCNKDSDCNCSERENRTIECSCHDNHCLSIEAD